MGLHGFDGTLKDFVGHRLQGVTDDDVLPTGLEVLDDLISGGLRTGAVVLLTGLPGVGTSMMALGFARASAIGNAARTLVCTDDPEHEVLARVVSAHTKIALPILRRGDISSDQRIHVQLRDRRASLADAPLGFDRGIGSLDNIESLLDRTRVDGMRLVVIDTGTELPEFSRDLARRLKVAAQAHHVSIVLAVRLPATAPRAEQLADVCAVHPGAAYVDTVISLDRDDMHSPESLYLGECELRVLRNRWGPCAFVTVAFQAHYARFVDMIGPGGEPYGPRSTRKERDERWREHHDH